MYEFTGIETNDLKRYMIQDLCLSHHSMGESLKDMEYEILREIDTSREFKKNNTRTSVRLPVYLTYTLYTSLIVIHTLHSKHYTVQCPVCVHDIYYIV